MPNINMSAKDESEEDVIAILRKLSYAAATAGIPVMVSGVGRRISTGGFEHLDLYDAISIPFTDEGIALAKERSAEVAAVAFDIVSREVNDRFMLIKNPPENAS